MRCDKLKKGKRKMNVDVAKLRGKMVEKGFSVETLAALIGIDRSSLYRKLGTIEKFTIGEARKIKAVLGLTNEEAILIFLP
jgi:DNA invertase Pin-like site-specific DNA recombinase